MNSGGPCRLLIAVCFFLSFDSFAQDFAAGEQAFAQQDYARALRFFEAAIEGGSEGPAAHYNRAVSLYRLGDYSRAAEAFRALGADFPAMRDLADYNLGLALVQLERNDAALDAFARASRSESEEISALALAMIDRLEPAPDAGSPNPWTRLVNLRVGHDDNVALIDELGLPPGDSTGSPFNEVLLYTGGPVTPTNRLVLDASLYSLQYPESGEFDQMALYLGLRYRRTAGDWSWAIGPQFGRTELGGSGFDRSAGVGVDLTRALGAAGADLIVNVRYDDYQSLSSIFDYIDGQRTQATVGIGKNISDGRITAAYTIDRDDRTGSGVNADRKRYRFSFSRNLGSRWQGEARIEHRKSDYRKLITPRRESRNEAGFSAATAFETGWRFEVDLRFANNDSNDPLFDFDRRLISVGVGRYF